MYPPAFEYQAPDTLEGALAALAELGDEGGCWPEARA